MECNVCQKPTIEFHVYNEYRCSNCGAVYRLQNADELFAAQLATELSNGEKIRAIRKLRDLCFAVDGSSPGLRSAKLIVEAAFQAINRS